MIAAFIFGVFATLAGLAWLARKKPAAFDAIVNQIRA